MSDGEDSDDFSYHSSEDSFGDDYFEAPSGLVDGGAAANDGSGNQNLLEEMLEREHQQTQERQRSELAQGHFIIPEGTTTFVSRHSWKKWGVDKKAVKTVIIPDSVATIGDNSFHGCSSLASITIPDSVATIGGNAFFGCSSLASVAIPDSVTTIGERAFCACSSLASITIPDSVTAIGDHAFASCSSLASITIPASVTTIGYHAFDGCSSLASITIPDSVTSIETSSFYGCSSLASITIPDSVTSIGEFAFWGCSSLTTAIIRPATANHNGGLSSNLWRTVFEIPPAHQRVYQSQVPAPFEHIAKISAPDFIVNQLTGPFAEYSTLASIPRAMRAAPDATTWAGVQLWLHWSDPEVDAREHRVLCMSRQRMVWTVMHVAERLDILPSEMWLLIFTFVKHG